MTQCAICYLPLTKSHVAATFQNKLLNVAAVALLFCWIVPFFGVAFQPPSTVVEKCLLHGTHSHTLVSTTRIRSDTFLEAQDTVSKGASSRRGGLWGRLRKKRVVEQTPQIQVGGTIPDVEVELLTAAAQTDSSETLTQSTPISIHDILRSGGGPAVLVGTSAFFVFYFAH
jgi:hypothetical protein